MGVKARVAHQLALLSYVVCAVVLAVWLVQRYPYPRGSRYLAQHSISTAC